METGCEGLEGGQHYWWPLPSMIAVEMVSGIWQRPICSCFSISTFLIFSRTLSTMVCIENSFPVLSEMTYYPFDWEQYDIIQFLLFSVCLTLFDIEATCKSWSGDQRAINPWGSIFIDWYSRVSWGKLYILDTLANFGTFVDLIHCCLILPLYGKGWG